MLILNQQATLQAATYTEILAAAEKAILLYETEAYYMPNRPHFDYGQNTLLLMPCFDSQRFGTKIVSVFPENRFKNLPSIYGSMLLNDGNTGQPLTLMNAATLTALRTGAVGGVSIKYMTPDNATTLGIVGTGIQGLYQAIFA